VVRADYSILSVGRDRRLLDLRNQVLRQAGFHVVGTCDEGDALRMMKGSQVSFLLLCHSVPEGVRATLIETFRKFCPRGRIIGISNVPWPQAGDVDAVVYGVEGPEALIQTITGRLAA
jgi:DNA-binding NarL/FixJ family response regulator